ncbi:F-box/LRR-repeat protein 3 [Prunus yedoensis var. nudiflora]|uniref:F-box/LRR-repeat protein 3 n=1 Tax=Prunus yedoensis var. nudiflora TaxID=2094558 RepID=A0A314Z0Q6_PRUYE|nr:F-box/LRR-repeat protein 3 [Prunus yedoensis var. nudiflora]
MKRQRTIVTFNSNMNNNNNHLFHFLSEEIIFIILDFLNQNPIDKKAFSLACKSFYAIEAKHRKKLKPLRSEHIPKVLNRYPHVSHIDLTLCPRITDTSLTTISNACMSSLRSIDLSGSNCFSGTGLLSLAVNCKNLVEINLSNATELRDSAVAALAEAKNLEKLWLGRCKQITDMGVGCIAVGCRKLRLISLKWCPGVGDLGVGLLAVKCKDIRSLDLSYLPITDKCLPSIFKLQYLEDLVLEGCFGIDDDSLSGLKHGCKSLKKLDISSCQNITHIGLSSLTSGSGSGRLSRANHIVTWLSVTLALADSLKKLPMLQSIKLDDCPVTYAGLKAIGNWCASLRELSLSKCAEVTDESLSSLLTKHKDLRKLDITCCRKITYASIDHITNSCTALTSLRMESCTLVPREAFVLIGQRCQFLEEIDITDNEVDDEGLKSICRCSNLSSLKLGICLNITDEGVANIGMCCSKLVELDLYRCTGISDSGISAVASGCPGLEMINIAYSAIAVGCKQLAKLDIKKCSSIDDAGMIPLAHFSQNLRQINLSYSSVSDVGLLSLASISCLQSLTILHLKGLSPSGLAAALLACRGLTKVKLQATFKTLLPQALFEHLEARGCVFQWRDKFFRAELDPQCWKIQLEDIMQMQ